MAEEEMPPYQNLKIWKLVEKKTLNLPCC